MERIKTFLEKNKIAIQGVSSIIQAVMVIVLVIVTVIYTIDTNEMANTMSKEFELTNRPYLAIEQFVPVPDKDGNVQYWLSLKNVGKLPAELKSIETGIPHFTTSGNYIDEKPKIINASQMIYPLESIQLTSYIGIYKDYLDKTVPSSIKIRYSGENEEKEFCIQYGLVYHGDPKSMIQLIKRIEITSSKLCE